MNMRVRELIEVLSRCDPNLPVATHANNHTAADEEIRVGLLHHYAGDHIVIGNISKLNINGTNWHVAEMLDGDPDVPRDWGSAETPRIYIGKREDHECSRCDTLNMGDKRDDHR